MRKATDARPRAVSGRLPAFDHNGNMRPVNVRTAFWGVILAASFLASNLRAQAAGDGGKAQLDAIVKKLDEQNAKIDALSQQLLKLEQQLGTQRPGVMIGEATPAPTAPVPSAPIPAPSPAAAGNSHVVARGETLTSIAKMHKVGVEDLQKFNHIENDRKLQIGQSIMIPPVPAASASAAPSAPAPNE